MHHSRLTLFLPLIVAALYTAAAAQPASQPVRQGSGPVTDLSTNAGAGGGPVRGSVTGTSLNAGRLSGNSVRASVTGDVASGPVSDVSVGAVTADNPVAGGGAVSQASVGAVKKDVNSPLGEMISQPLRELGPLQDRLRAIQPAPRDGPVPGDEVHPPDEPTLSGAATDAPAAHETIEEPDDGEDLTEPEQDNDDEGVEANSDGAPDGSAATPAADEPTPVP